MSIFCILKIESFLRRW